mmetsp:Transcript_25081/g.46031  ORF Transcript_25081/g.46031 Transcript_25081/m.46031 type:complete len:318 (-) Transcript_25081:7-960(-)
MGKKKEPGSTKYEAPFELKPFCYYCDRDFDSAKTLIQHQRTKHFCCSECGLKFDTVMGLRVHMLNAYKKPLKEVPGAIPGRDNTDIVVHGMEGVPKTIIEEKTRKAAAEQRVDKTEKPPREDRPTKADRSDVRERAQLSDTEEGLPSRKRRSATEGASPSERQPATKPLPPLPPAVQHEEKQLRPAVSFHSVPPPEGMAARTAPSLQPPPPPTPSQSAPSEEAISAVLSCRLAADRPLSGVSAAVVQLLVGDANAEGEIPRGGGNAKHVPGYAVPPALLGLHPVALKALAATGQLTSSARPLGLEPPEKRARIGLVA